MLLVVVVVVVVATSSVTGVEEVWPVLSPISCFCNSTKSPAPTYLPGSRFAGNLASASRSVPANASASGGFFKGSIGAAPDTLYALALCRGDFTLGPCASCLEAAFQYPQVPCNRSRDVALYYDQCQIRFSDQDFLAGAGNEPETAATKLNNISVPVFPGWDPGNGDSVSFVTGTVYTLLRETAKRAAYNSSRRYATTRAAYNSSRRYATTRMVAGGTFPELYALTQCTPDLSPNVCFGCREDIIQQSLKWFEGRQGGRIQKECAALDQSQCKFYGHSYLD